MPPLTFELQQLINPIPSESLNEWAPLYSSVLQENKTSMKSVLFIFVCKIVVSLFVLLCGFGCHWWSIVCPSVTSPCNLQLCKCAIVQLYSCSVVHLCNCAIAHCDSDCSSHSSKVKSSSQLLLLLSSQLGILTVNYQIALLQPNVNHKVHLSGSQHNSLNHLTPQSITDTVSAVGPTLTECITVLVIPTPSTHILTHLPRTKGQRMVS